MSRVQLSVTVSPEMGQYVEEISAQLGVKKSAVVEHALEVDRQRRKELLMRKGYEEMAEHDLSLVREFEDVDRESPWPDY